MRTSAGASVATIYDVARAAGVSIKTVSRVLNREPNVRPETLKRVTAAAAALRYRPNVSARSLAGARSYLLGLLFDNPNHTYVSAIQFGALSQCRQAGYHLMVELIDHSAPDIRSALRAMLDALSLDGLILTPPICDVPGVLDALDEAGTAYVRIAPDRELERAPRVHMDDRRAARDMTELLLGLGHREIGFIKGHPEHGASHLRYEGYREAMERRGAPIRPEWTPQGYFSFRSGADCAEALLAGGERPTAVFASNDEMALGLMSAANRRGLAIPAELSIAGFDDSPNARIVWPQLTTVRQPVAEMAAAAAEMLISSLSRGRDRAPDRLLDFEIVVRDTTAPLRTGAHAASHEREED